MSRFHTLEVSDPAYEFEGLRWATIKSPALKARADASLWVPANPPANLPVVILLHGVYGSHWAWSLKGGAHRLAARLIAAGAMPPMALVMPSDGLWGDGSCYLPHVAADYESWIVDDVPALARELVPAVTAASPLFLAGLSMGGYGALRLGGAYAGRFSGISAHSAATTFAAMDEFTAASGHQYDLVERTPRDAFGALVASEDALPPLRFDCGIEDSLLEGNRKLHRQLTEAGIAHDYAEFPGGHTWDYWGTHLEDTLLFFGEIAGTVGS